MNKEPQIYIFSNGILQGMVNIPEEPFTEYELIETKILTDGKDTTIQTTH